MLRKTQWVLRHNSDRAERALLTALHDAGQDIVATTGQTGRMLRKTHVADLIDFQTPELLCWICAAM